MKYGRAISDSIALVLIALSSATLSGYIVWSWGPSTPAYEVTKSDKHWADVRDGMVYTHRSYCINAGIPVVISRDLVKRDVNQMIEIRYSLPTTEKIFEVGCYDVVRAIELPKGLPAGPYDLEHNVSWQANPIRRDSVELPVLKITIPN